MRVLLLCEITIAHKSYFVKGMVINKNRLTVSYVYFWFLVEEFLNLNLTARIRLQIELLPQEN